MQLFLLNTTPPTKFFSCLEYKKSQNGKRKDYILKLLQSTPEGKTCREISDISGIWIQSLCNPLKELEKTKLIKVEGVRRCNLTNRLVQVYCING
jgi:predicted transcriptional regulator